MYNVNRQDLTTAASGDGGEVALPVIPFAGLVAAQRPARHGDAVAEPAARRRQPHGECRHRPRRARAWARTAQARNIGLDFVSPTEVNTLQVWVDRELPAEHRQCLLVGNLQQRRQPAPGDGETVGVRGAVRPVREPVPASTFAASQRGTSRRSRDRCRAPSSTRRATRTSSSPRCRRSSRSRQARRVARWRERPRTSTPTCRLRILDAPSLYYEGSYWFTDVRCRRTDREHPVERLVGQPQVQPHVRRLRGRAALEQGTQAEGRRTATLTDATLTVDPIHTLTTLAAVHGAERTRSMADRVTGPASPSRPTRSSTGASTLQCGFGWNFTTRETGEDLRDRLRQRQWQRSCPRQHLTLTFTYADTTTTRSGIFVGRSAGQHAERAT